MIATVCLAATGAGLSAKFVLLIVCVLSLVAVRRTRRPQHALTQDTDHATRIVFFLLLAGLVVAAAGVRADEIYIPDICRTCYFVNPWWVCYLLGCW